MRTEASPSSRRSRSPRFTLPPGLRVIADRSNDSLEAQYDWKGEAVMAFGAKKFWSVVSVEREQARDAGRSSETARVERLVWNLGSTRYLES